MNAKTLLEDAQVLLGNGRFEGALLLVLVAIAGTSKRRSPPPCSDAKAFTDFLHDEWFAIAPCAGMRAVVDGKEVPMESILYKVLRCTVLHEGEMPEELVFKDSQTWFIRREHGRFILSRNWITGLMRSVVLAKENQSLFKDVASQWKAPWWPPGSSMTVTNPGTFLLGGGPNMRVARGEKEEAGTS